jgi:hypothetical protein
LLTNRSDRSRELSWIQIGSVAGPTAAVPSAALRSANFRLLGSGQGSVSTSGYVAELPSLVDVIAAGKLKVNSVSIPLSKVEEVWSDSAYSGQRVVLVPRG